MVQLLIREFKEEKIISDKRKIAKIYSIKVFQSTNSVSQTLNSYFLQPKLPDVKNLP